MLNLGLTNTYYFSLNSLFKVRLRMHVTHKEAQFLARGLKYANNALQLGVVKKRRDITLRNNYSSQYPRELMEYACHLLLAYRKRPICTQVRQDVLIKNIFTDVLLKS